MRRYYRVRIILSAMLSFVILLMLAVGGIWLYSYYQMERETDRFLASQLNTDKEERPPFSQDAAPPMFGYTLKPRQYPSGFYDITLNEAGEVLALSQRGMMEDASVSVQQEVAEIAARGEEKGKIGSYKYQIAKNDDGTCRMILMDISIQLYSQYRMLRSAGMVALGMVGMLLIILLPISGRLADAFVRNAEKQKQFITDAGHDLKTPVAIARANLDVLELTQGKTKWSANIHAQMDRLEKLVQQLVMMARLDERQEEKLKKKIDAEPVFRAVWQEYQTMVGQKKIRASADIHQGLSIHGTEEALRQMLRLLMDNAVQYTPEEGEIHFSAGMEKKAVRLILENTAFQFPSQPPEELTNRFVRGSAARTQKTGGSGIGLAAVKRIVEMHQGKLHISYEEENVFRVQIDLPT